MNDLHITAIIPAAGLSSRMGAANKLLLEINGMPIIERVVRACLDLKCVRVLVVTGHVAEQIAEAVSAFPIQMVYNSDYGKGMGASLIAGVAAARAPTGYLVWPADMPFVQPETSTRLFAEYQAEAIIVPSFEGRRGHPVLFGADFREALLAIPPEKGARSVLERNANAVWELPVDDPGILQDIDTPEDLR